MKWPAKDVLILVVLVCFAYPLAAGLWWRYYSGHSEAKPTGVQQVRTAGFAAGAAQ